MEHLFLAGPHAMTDAWPGGTPGAAAARGTSCPGRAASVPRLPHRQATLAGEVRLAGRGLHTGRATAARVRPAEPGHGITFRLAGSGPRPASLVPALWRHRVSQPLCTALQAPDGAVARTVEHLMAALSAFGIDNAAVDLEGGDARGGEVPILDGSALPWCEALLEAGRAEQASARRYLRVRRAVEVRAEDRFVRVEPAADLEAGLSLEVSLPLAGFGELAWQGALSPATFHAELAPSRSFGRLKWALPAKLYGLLTRRPLLRGAGLHNTAALLGPWVVGGMRVPHEPARHRALDIVGDFALAGHPLVGRVTARRPGHEINHALLARLMGDPAAWSTETLDGTA